ncbi:MAG TPA: hypothetical protein VF779_07985 [Pyrinomonadaceae bacterium]
MSQERDFKRIAAAAGRILEAFGHAETSDSPRVIYTENDLNIASDGQRLEIIYRGTLVFRYAPALAAGEPVFEEHGDWASLVERLADDAEQSGPKVRD